jgi:ATP-dependent HslUV protease ATP-binding subunit HslU
LGADEFYRILTEPENALIRQYQALMETEGIELIFEDEAIRALAQIAAEVNESTENIGARRLHTVLERVLEELSFTAPELEQRQFMITAEYVRSQLGDISRNEDLSRFIL